MDLSVASSVDFASMLDVGVASSDPFILLPYLRLVPHCFCRREACGSLAAWVVWKAGVIAIISRL